MEEELKSVLREAFGGSSSDSDGESSQHERRRRLQINDSSDEIVKPPSIFGNPQIWEAIAEINGLWICRDFLSSVQQSTLLSALGKEGYFAEDSHNQAMRFGDLPPWAMDLSQYIRENVLLSDCLSESTDLSRSDKSGTTCPFPPELLWREPLFNQLIFNIYQPGNLCAC